MKKLVLLAMALLVAVGVMAEGMFPDVPAKHWAYPYVEHLKSKGIVIGYPDGTFKGDRNITRYEEAAMISRLIGLIETEIVAPHISDVLRVLDAISLKLGATVQKVDQLESKLNAMSGVSGELSSVSSKLTELTKSVEMLKQTVNIHDKDIVKLYETVANLQKSLDAKYAELQKICEARFAELSAADAATLDKIAALEKTIDQLDAKIVAVQKKLLSLEPMKDILKDLTTKVTAQGERLTLAEGKIGDLSATLDNAVMTLGYVSIKLDRAQENLNKVTDRVSALEEKAKMIDENAKAIEALKQDLSNKFSELEAKFSDFAAMHDEQINYVMDELDNVNTQIEELRDGLFALREDTASQFAQTTTSIENLMVKIEELQKANLALTGAVIGAIIVAVAAMIVGAM